MCVNMKRFLDVSGWMLCDWEVTGRVFSACRRCFGFVCLYKLIRTMQEKSEAFFWTCSLLKGLWFPYVQQYWGYFFSNTTIDFIFSQLLCYTQILYSFPNISHLFSITWAISKIIILLGKYNVLPFWNQGDLTLGLFGQCLMISVSWHTVVFLMVSVRFISNTSATTSSAYCSRRTLQVAVLLSRLSHAVSHVWHR